MTYQPIVPDARGCGCDLAILVFLIIGVLIALRFL